MTSIIIWRRAGALFLSLVVDCKENYRGPLRCRVRVWRRRFLVVVGVGNRRRQHIHTQTAKLHQPTATQRRRIHRPNSPLCIVDVNTVQKRPDNRADTRGRLTVGNRQIQNGDPRFDPPGDRTTTPPVTPPAIPAAATAAHAAQVRWRARVRPRAVQCPRDPGVHGRGAGGRTLPPSTSRAHRHGSPLPSSTTSTCP